MVFTFTLSHSASVYAQTFNDTIPGILNDTIPSVLNDTIYTVVNDTIHTVVNDTIYIESPDSITDATIIFNEEDTLALNKAMAQKPSFVPNPKKAVLYSAIFPGLGQIYNKKYWKLPIVYGGIMGFAYAISWNNKTYQDYNTAYKDFYFDKEAYNDKENPPPNPMVWKESWQEYLSTGRTPEDAINDASFENFLKRGSNNFRRYRDLSIILAVAWYFLCMADAYVDAQLFDFDISPDLSLRVEPVVTPRTRVSPDLYGINCSIKF